jgi:hypothetical protein|tara:strand:+ start:316 stop:987 length:672 start_codon:yes stop_codon:yes gene_type:complete
MNHDYENEDNLWEAYHTLLLGPDTGRLKKMLVRYDLYSMTKDIQGDILECGVFKGAGLMFWLKLLSIYEPDSAKKVVGFDTFKLFGGALTDIEKQTAEEYMEEAAVREVSKDSIFGYAGKAGLDHRVELVEGDIAMTSEKYVQENPDRSISLLHLDLDTYDGTKASLESLYPSVSSGGIIIFDEYGDPKWNETEAVDEFFADKDAEVIRISHSSKPSAYILKK